MVYQSLWIVIMKMIVKAYVPKLHLSLELDPLKILNGVLIVMTVFVLWKHVLALPKLSTVVFVFVRTELM
ncbi:MAG: hypothetical protein CME98_25260 [Hyphomonas sp.]|nr:hypothetical protein [Hyphomonas sp.]